MEIDKGKKAGEEKIFPKEKLSKYAIDSMEMRVVTSVVSRLRYTDHNYSGGSFVVG